MPLRDRELRAQRRRVERRCRARRGRDRADRTLCSVAVIATAQSWTRSASPAVNADEPLAHRARGQAVVVVVARQRAVEVVEVVVPAPRVGVGRRPHRGCRRVDQRARRCRSRSPPPRRPSRSSRCCRARRRRRARSRSCGSVTGASCGSAARRRRWPASNSTSDRAAHHDRIIGYPRAACRRRAEPSRSASRRSSSRRCRVARDRAVQAAVRRARDRARRSLELIGVGYPLWVAFDLGDLGADTLLRTALPVGDRRGRRVARGDHDVAVAAVVGGRGAPARRARSTRSSRRARIASRSRAPVRVLLLRTGVWTGRGRADRPVPARLRRLAARARRRDRPRSRRCTRTSCRACARCGGRRSSARCAAGCSRSARRSSGSTTATSGGSCWSR